jgi:hypothetical protein
MRMRTLTTAGVFIVAIGAAAAGQQKWTEARTPWGDPEFDGIWTYATMTPLERPRELADQAILSADEAAAYERRTIERQSTTNNTAGPDWWDPGTRHLAGRRTSLIVDPPDGHIPPLTPEAQKAATTRAQARRGRGPAEGPEDLALNERCLQWATAGPPMLPGVYNNNVEFIQTRGFVVIVNEMIHDARIVPMDGRPHDTVRRWMGDSRGRWESSTLVIDTVNFSDKVSVRGSDENLHLVERFTRTGPESLDYRFTIDDPTIWTRPWTVAVPMTRSDGRMYEYACHEGNARSVEGILRGARTQDRP